MLQQRRRTDGEVLTIEPMSVKELYRSLDREHAFGLEHHLVRAAVNGSYVADDHQLRGGEEVVFIPPVSGG